MANKVIVLLGGNILNEGLVKFKEKFGADTVVVVDWNENPSVKGDIFFKHDIKDSSAIIEKLESLGEIDLRFVYTSADLAVDSQRIIHKKYGFLCADEKAINKTLHKNIMTEIWNENNLLNRIAVTILNENELNNIKRDCKLIVKPNLCSGSRGITVLNANCNDEQLLKAYKRAIDVSWDDKVVIEEFIEGTEYTVEMIGDSYGNVEVECVSKKYHTNHTDNNKIAVKLHYNPNDVDDEELERIANYGRECYKALGLHTSLGHLELIVADDGRICPLEIGARSSGYIASNCVDLVSGEIFLNKYADVIRGGKVENKSIFHTNKSSMLFFYDMPEGKIVNSGCVLDFTRPGITSVSSNHSKIVAGNTFNKIDGDNERIGFEILAGNRDVLTIENVIKAENDMNDFLYMNEK